MRSEKIPSVYGSIFGTVFVCCIVCVTCVYTITDVIKITQTLKWPSHNAVIDEWVLVGKVTGRGKVPNSLAISIVYSYKDSTNQVQKGTYELVLPQSQYQQFKIDRKLGLPVQVLVNPADQNETCFNLYRGLETSRLFYLFYVGLAASFATACVVLTARMWLRARD